MKVVDVILNRIELPLLEPGLCPGWSGGLIHYRHYPVQILRVLTDEGIMGIALAERMTKNEIEDYWKPYLLNKEIDFFSFEKRAEMTSLQMMPACVEIALWDIAGKIAKQPIYRLLGGCRDKVKAYATTINLKEPEERAKDALTFLEMGFKAMKIRAHFPNPRKDLDVIKAIRDAVGDDIDIMVDANQASHMVPPIWSHRTSYKMAIALEKLDVFWLEEPLHHEDLDGIAELTKRMRKLMIAGAEGERSLRRFRQYFDKGCFDIVQPETIWAGIYNVKKIAVLAEAYDKMVAPHAHAICGLGLASSLQVAGAIPNCPYIEFGYEPPTISIEQRDRVLKQPITVDRDGNVPIPKDPGLGVELNEEFVTKCTVQEDLANLMQFLKVRDNE